LSFLPHNSRFAIIYKTDHNVFYGIYEPDKALNKSKTAIAIIQKDNTVVTFQIVLLTRKANKPDSINAKEQINTCAAALKGSVCADVNKYIISSSRISVPIVTNPSKSNPKVFRVRAFNM